MNSFDDLNLSEPVAKALKELGFTAPTPIQQQALPVLLGAPTDFIGLAATGTGKTAAFGIPLLEKIDTHKGHVQALVLCPTRELALQVCEQLSLMGKHKGIKTLAIYGGTGYDDQFHGLKRGAHVVVGTPGRIGDHLDRKSLSLSHAKTIVLDEADEMISMGFKDDLEKILQATQRQHSHIWLFSATMSSMVRKVADTYLRSPKQAQVNKKEMLSGTVDQVYYVVRESDKPEILRKLIDLTDDFYGLVFCQTKALVQDLTQYLKSKGYPVDCLHGDMSQDQRERAMKAFRDKQTTLLVCTDVASRGLDVKELTHVINYSIPRETELYVHRIGRTARGGKTGVAISLVTPNTRVLVNKVQYVTKSQLREGKIPGRRDVAAKKIARVLEQFKKQDGFKKAAELLDQEQWVQVAGELTLDEIIARFIMVIAPEAFEEAPKEKPLVQKYAAGRHSEAPRKPKFNPYKGQNYKGNRPDKHKPHLPKKHD